jgi:hypothetical protein
MVGVSGLGSFGKRTFVSERSIEDASLSPIRQKVRDRSIELKRSGLDAVEQAVALIQEFGSNLDGDTGAHFSSPAEAGAFAKQLNGNLQSSIEQYNGALQARQPEWIEKLRKENGDAFVETYLKLNEENLKAAKSLLEADQAIIGKAFDVVGKLLEWSEDGRPKLGAFALSGNGVFATGPRGAPAGAAPADGALVLTLTDYQAEADAAAARVRETRGLGVDKRA